MISKPKIYSIDFEEIADMEDFYAAFRETLLPPDYFGDNLDALADFISGEASLPLELEFTKMSVDQLEEFENLIDVLETLEEETDEFSFRFYLEQFNIEE